MDPKEAIRAYQFGERAKSELLMLAQLLTFVADLPKEQQEGGKRVLLTTMENVRTETSFAMRTTGMIDFQKAIDRVSEAISLAESNQFLEASQRVGSAISAATTAAQKGWQVLNEHGLL